MEMIFPILTEDVRKQPLYVTSVGGRASQEPTARPLGFPSWHWLHVLNGLGRLEIDGREYLLRSGTGFLMAPNVPHKYETVEAPWETRFLTFEGASVSVLVNYIMESNSSVFRLRSPELLEQALGQIHLACTGNAVMQILESSAFLHMFLVLLARNAVAWDTRMCTEAEGGFHEVLKHIEANYRNPITLDMLAELAKVSPQHLCRLFRQHVNARPFEYIARVRLQKAKSAMLLKNDWSLKQIAEYCGFSDPSYFAKQFRHYEGITPMIFRRMYGR